MVDSFKKDTAELAYKELDRFDINYIIGALILYLPMFIYCTLYFYVLNKIMNEMVFLCTFILLV